MQGVPTLEPQAQHLSSWLLGRTRREGRGYFLSLAWPTVTHFVNRLLTQCIDERKEVCHRPSVCVSLNSDPETQFVV